ELVIDVRLAGARITVGGRREPELGPSHDPTALEESDVAARVLHTPCGPRVEVFQLDAEHGGLKRVQAEIPADELVIVLRLAPVHAQHANSFSQVLATCQHHACVAQRSEVLAREERQAPKIAQCASSTAVTILGSDRLSGVLDDGDAMLRSDLEDR